MASKPLSLADRIRETRKANTPENETESEQKLINKIQSFENTKVTIQDQDSITVGSGSYQDHITKGPDTYQVRSRYVSDKDHHFGSPKDQDSITIPKRQKKITKGSPSESLSKSQTIVLLWFRQKGESGLFNKPEIERDLGIPYITVRKAIKKLENVGMLKLNYDTCQKLYEYKISENTDIRLSKNITIGSGSYQDRITKGSAPLISSSSNINTTTEKNPISETQKAITEIMTTDPEYKYWIDQQLGPNEVFKLKNEYGLDLQTILNNLCYIRWQILKQGDTPKTSPSGMLKGIMKKSNGYVNKPANYKTLAQLDLEALEQWRDQQIEIAKKREKLQFDVIETELGPEADRILYKPSLENEYFKYALETVATAKTRNAIELIIRSGKQLDESHKAILKPKIVKALSEKIKSN